MWQLIKYEIYYNWYYLILITVLFLTYTVLSLFDIQLTDSPEFMIDYWGGIFSLVVYVFLFSTWGSRVKEKRIRFHSLLPLSQQHNSYSRFWLAGLPFFAIIAYLFFLHLIVINDWHNETGSMIGQIGVCFIIFTGFIRGRDDWFSYWEFGKRTSAAFVSVLIIQVLVVFVFLGLPDLNNGLVGYFGPKGFQYAKLIFPLLGLVILTTTIFSFRKRRSYLS